VLIKQKVKFFFVSLLLFGAIVFLLIVVEQFLQLKHISSVFNRDHFIRIRTFTPNTNTAFTPTSKDILDSFYLDLKSYSALTDSFGFIVTNRNHSQPDLKLGFFGGSTARNLYTDEDKRMPEAVARIVEKETGLKVNVWNCAAGGTHSNHTLNLLNNLAMYLNLDYAFFYGNINDIGTMIHYGTYNTPNPEKGIFFSLSEYQKRNTFSEDYILPYTLDAVKRRLNLINERDDFADARKQELILDSLRVIPPIIKIYKTIIYSCKANNVRPVIISQVTCFDRLSYQWMAKNMPVFSPGEEGYGKFKILIHQYNNALRQLAKEENVLFIDLQNEQFGFNDFYDAIHFNSKGSAAVSQLIARQFIEKMKLKSD
jgi:hypothetical protein